MKFKTLHFILDIVFVIGASGSCLAQAAAGQPEAAAAVKVGVLLEAPFVQKDAAGHYGGYSFELWEEVGRKLGRTSEIREFDTFPALLEGVSSGAVDVAVADIFITGEREKRMDFTHPIADGGLRVMVNAGSRHSLKRLWNGLVGNGHVAVFGYGTLVVVGFSVLLMFLWRRTDREFPRTPSLRSKRSGRFSRSASTPLRCRATAACATPSTSPWLNLRRLGCRRSFTRSTLAGNEDGQAVKEQKKCMPPRCRLFV
ncbi:MAG: transporter substrate-binding domain-containing protein [Lentisphaeria bacterium]